MNATDHTTECLRNLLMLIESGEFLLRGDGIRTAAEVLRRSRYILDGLEKGSLEVLEVSVADVVSDG